MDKPRVKTVSFVNARKIEGTKQNEQYIKANEHDRNIAMRQLTDKNIRNLKFEKNAPDHEILIMPANFNATLENREVVGDIIQRTTRYQLENESGKDGFRILKSFYNFAKKNSARHILLKYNSSENENEFSWKTMVISKYDTFHKFFKRVYEMENTKEIYDDISNGYYIDTNYLTTRSYVQIQGGANNKSDVNYKSLYFKAYTLKSQNNNCIFAIINRVLKLNKRHQTLRNLCDIPHDSMISLDEIENIENKLDCSINIYNDNCTVSSKIIDGEMENKIEYSMSYKSKSESDNIINILYNDDHYMMISSFKKVAEIKGKKKKNHYETTHILTFDYETINDENQMFLTRPYSIAYTLYDINKKTSKSYFHMGFDCTKQFMKFINESKYYHKYVIIGYNNSRFDNFMLLNEYAKNGFSFSQCLYVNNSILTATIKSHKIIDLNRFITGSLKHNCESFKCDIQKSEFDHSIPQDYFNNNKFNDFIEKYKPELKKYNILDVESLLSLVLKFNKNLGDMGFDDFYNYSTIGEMCYKKLKIDTKSYKKPNNIEDDEFIRKSLTAGRTQAFQKGDLTFDNDLKMVDVVSLYPSVMQMFNFPKGDYRKSEIYEKGKFGIYQCYYKCAPNQPNIMAHRGGDTLGWDNKKKFKTGMTNIDIETCEKYGHYYEVINGLVWDSFGNPFKNYIDNLIKIKSGQDVLKMNNSPDYNQALRETCKLCMNSISGKVIQRNFSDVISPIKKNFKESEIAHKFEKDSIHYFDIGNQIYMSGVLENEYRLKSSSKPCQLGVFIYSYARSFMYELIHAIPSRLYMDTDSLLFESKDYSKLDNLYYNDFHIKLYNGEGLKKLGQIEEECPPNSKRCIILA
ncbi:MAG: hypothetical protein GQ557_02575, partial [Mycoplasmataceae bacterium]|nr:hypothetical protein [Mycoplasmataceae bacterium]